MKYALVDNIRTHASMVSSGTIGNDLWFTDYEVQACVGKYRQYWKYIGDHPPYPNGYEPESDWHAAWKKPVKDDFCEVVCGNNNEHRADMKTDEFVIEIQKSSMDGYDVVERNNFYKDLSGNRLVWIVNIFKPWSEKRINTELLKEEKDIRFKISWSRSWSWVREIAKTTDSYLYLDFNPKSENLIYAWEFKGELYGKWAKKNSIFTKYLSGVLNEQYENKDSFLDIFADL